MSDIFEIDKLLNELQEETPNCGGQYHFTKLELIDYDDLNKSIKEYMLRFKEYQEPYYLNSETGQRSYLKWRDPENLKLKPVEDFELHLIEKLKYWSNHKTSLDCRENITDQYKPLEEKFINMVVTFLRNEEISSVYEIEFVDTFYCFGHDHVNDDTIIKTSKSFYILHFGWSS